MARFAIGWERPARKFLPRSLLARSLLIILVPLVLVLIVALVIFYGTHLNTISRRLSGAVAGELSQTVRLLQAAPNSVARDGVMRDAERDFEFRLRFDAGAQVPTGSSANILGPMDDDLTVALAQRVGLRVATNWTADPLYVLIAVQLPDGVLHADAPRKRLYTSTIYLFVMWLGGSAVVVFAIAALFTRNQVRAIRRLAAAAEAFGLGRDPGTIRPEGAAEVRRAATAFNRMQDRIRRFMTQRTEMLAGVSHDLRTPLTRMKLALAMLPAETRQSADVGEITADIEEMEGMIEAYLAFARGEQAEQAEAVNVADLLRDIAAGARRTGADIRVDAPASLPVNLRPGAIRRAMTNLVDNARRHGRLVALAASTTGRYVQVMVDDDGPGISADKRETVFRPFESGAAGGTGLGLTIARDIVRAHGGDIVLEKSPLGGLRARVSLPL